MAKGKKRVASATMVECANCTQTWKEADIRSLDQCKDLVARLDPGSEVPYGECPECGAFCYRKKGPQEDRVDIARQCVETFDQLTLQGDEPLEARMIDLVANLGHLAKQDGVDFAVVLRCAAMHVTEELEGGEA